MKLKLVIDKVGYNSKPQGKDGGIITKRMLIDTGKEYSIEEIKQSILAGKTIRPSYCGGQESEWKSQQVFMIDIDNEGNLTDDIILDDYVKLIEGKKTKVRFLVGSEQHKSYDDMVRHCKEINLIPNFIYTSFNHKEEQHKFRLVFILDKVIDDFNTAKKIHLYFMKMMGESDPSCKNLNRFYYAGKTIPFDNDNILNSNNIIELSKDIEVNETKQQSNNKSNSLNNSNSRKGVLDNIGIIILSFII